MSLFELVGLDAVISELVVLETVESVLLVTLLVLLSVEDLELVA